MVKRNTAYNVGDIEYTIDGIILKCTVAGTTATTPLDLSAVTTSTVTDGTVTWSITRISGGGSNNSNYGITELYSGAVTSTSASPITLNSALVNYDLIFISFGVDSNSYAEATMLYTYDDLKSTDKSNIVRYANNSFQAVLELNYVNDTTLDVLRNYQIGFSTTSWNLKIYGITLGNAYNAQETLIGRWVDGKPLYRKVFDNPTFPLSTGLSPATYSVKRVYGHATVMGGFVIDVPYSDTQTYACVYYDGNSNTLQQNNSSNVTINSAIVEYTKV